MEQKERPQSKLMAETYSVQVCGVSYIANVFSCVTVAAANLSTQGGDRVSFLLQAATFRTKYKKYSCKQQLTEFKHLRHLRHNIFSKPVTT